MLNRGGGGGFFSNLAERCKMLSSDSIILNFFRQGVLSSGRKPFTDEHSSVHFLAFMLAIIEDLGEK